MIYNLAGLFGISFSIEQGLRTLMGSILALIYSLIEYLYAVFQYLSKAQILESDFIQNIYRKVGMILGIFMLFKLLFSLIQSLIDPNKFTDKKKGFVSIIYRSIIAIVLLGITPTIFKEAFKIQNLIVGNEYSDNIIYKLISGNSSVGNINNMGRVIASDLYFSFYRDEDIPKLNEGSYDIMDYIAPSEAGESYDRFIKDDYDTLVSNVRNPDSEKNFHDTVSYLALKDNVTGKYVIEFNWLPLLVAGGFVVWILAMYCIQVAVRVVQLAYLQLIAPVPIISYITDPEGSFKKWTSQCISTFLDLFFRLAIIYFVVTMISDVLTQFSRAGGVIMESTGMNGEDWFTISLVKILIVIGLLLFASRVPELLKELFPNLGKGPFSFSLNPGKVFKDTLAGNVIGGAAGAVTAATVGAIGGGFKGFFGGLTKGAVSGLQGKKLSEIASARAAQNVKNRQMRNSGSTLGGRIDARFRNAFGLESRTAEIDNQIHTLDERIREIDDNPIFGIKRKNDAVIGAKKAIYDEAEKELLKSNDTLRANKLHVEYLRDNIGKLDANGNIIDENDVINAENTYTSELKRASEVWINANSDKNAALIRNMQVIANETGSTVSTIADVEAAADAAKDSNNKVEAAAKKLEHDKSILNAMKSNLSRRKEKPQADENAVK